MHKCSAITSVVGTILFAVLAISFSFAAPPVLSSPEIATNTSSDAIVLVYIPRWHEKNTSRRNYLLEILSKITKAVHKSAEVDGAENETKGLDSGDFFKDRIGGNPNRFRPGAEMNEEESRRPFDFPSSSSELDKEGENHSGESGPLTFLDRHNPNNILQKGSLVRNPNIQISETNSPSAGGAQSVNRRKTTQPTKTDAVDTNELTFDILKNSRWENDNAVMSPLSVLNFLSLLLLGADGRTFNELALKVRRKDPIDPNDTEKATKFHTTFQQLLRYLNTNSGNDVSLEIANIVFTDTKYPIRDSFLTDAMQYYDAPAKSIDFSSNGEQFKNLVNGWVSQKTRGKIQNIVQESPTGKTAFAFVNAVYFKGKWETPFSKAYTKTKDFFVSPREIIPVKLMTDEMKIPYMENDQFQMISLPYKDKKTAFFVILPRENGVEGLRNLETKLDAKMLTESIKSMRSETVAIKLPKMQIRTDGQLQDVLIKMGLSSIFDPQTANFTRLSQTKGLFISSVYHQACIDVDEVGTEASAVTIGVVDRIIAGTPKTFTANRPFIFFVYHFKADTTLFWGRLVRPQFPE